MNKKVCGFINLVKLQYLRGVTNFDFLQGE